MSHHHHHHHDYAQANKEYFDKKAEVYDEQPQVEEMARRLSRAMLDVYPFDEASTTVMDFACGTGLISRELAPYAQSIVGVDISQGMVDHYNLRVQNQGLLPEEMKAVCIDLKGRDDELDGAKFDVIVCALAYHHFSSIQDITRTLSFFLKPGGSLLVADHSSVDASVSGTDSKQVQSVVPHHSGFDELEMQTVFKEAGLESFTYTKITRAKIRGRLVQLFLVKGSKSISTL